MHAYILFTPFCQTREILSLNIYIYITHKHTHTPTYIHTFCFACTSAKSKEKKRQYLDIDTKLCIFFISNTFHTLYLAGFYTFPVAGFYCIRVTFPERRHFSFRYVLASSSFFFSLEYIVLSISLSPIQMKNQ